ncbi:hypothetical protein [endosymbiont GvMRE of Glomus versiforme]|uniref:hypothetical protein n=1 Tax=endosymbiont GvMRE of Glomus versiforme TaxID=2039283 RepID=UPI000EC76FA1|nr:hypothetical protein [endosymbiont GvMRE of Glomus versiforme]RHZ35196.1 hypothetical protein GvMRE_IIg119 [endosymbiont GvMRE of Glomus versiforme]
MQLFIPEILSEIISNLETDSSSLFKLSLVSRNLAKCVIPFLWKQPFSISDKKHHSKIISILLFQLLPPEAQEFFEIDNLIKLQKIPFFDYASFLKKLNTSKIFDAITMLYIGIKNREFQYNYLPRLLDITRSFFKLLLKSCNNQITEIIISDNTVLGMKPFFIKFIVNILVWQKTFLSPLNFLSNCKKLKHLHVDTNSFDGLFNTTTIYIQPPCLQRLYINSLAISKTELQQILAASNLRLEFLTIYYNYKQFYIYKADEIIDVFNAIATNCQNLLELVVSNVSSYYFEYSIPIFKNCRCLRKAIFYFDNDKKRVIRNENILLQISQYASKHLLSLRLEGGLFFSATEIFDFFNERKMPLKLFQSGFFGNMRSMNNSLSSMQKKARSEIVFWSNHDRQIINENNIKNEKNEYFKLSVKICY